MGEDGNSVMLFNGKHLSSPDKDIGEWLRINACEWVNVMCDIKCSRWSVFF